MTYCLRLCLLAKRPENRLSFIHIYPLQTILAEEFQALMSPMNHVIDLQIACDKPLPVSEDQLIAWVNCALNEHQQERELTLRLVESAEISALNHTYRQKEGPTNVLAFPSDLPEHIDLDCSFLGDVIVCPEVLEKEAQEQERPLDAHWAHIVIHGVLHLLGYDHYEDADTANMQGMEIRLLAGLGFPNPYQHEGQHLE